jgi:hypothetical protein
MKLFKTEFEKRERARKKEEAKAERHDRKSKHRMAMAMLLYKDRTFEAKEIDVDKERTVFFQGIGYTVPDIPYNMTKWWPFKARTYKRIIFPDQHYNIVWNEGEPQAIDITWAHMTAEHKNIMPSSWGGLIKETLFAQSVNSMKAKNKLHLDRKWVIVIVAVVAIVAVLIILGTGVLS